MEGVHFAAFRLNDGWVESMKLGHFYRGTFAMPISRLLQNSAFEPSEIRTLTEAFDAVCCELKLERSNDPLRDLIARKVIAFAECGTRDPKSIRVFVLAGVEGIYRHRLGGQIAA